MLVNCMIATLGFDCPEIECLILARPTKSIQLHIQMLGRGLRPADGKDHCLILDHGSNITRQYQARNLCRCGHRLHSPG